MSAVRYALFPLMWLVGLVVLASVLAYGALLILGDVLPIAKLISKITLGLLVLSVFPLRRYLALSWQDLGFTPWPQFLRQVRSGLLLGLWTLAPVMICLYVLDVQVWDYGRAWTLTKVIEKVALALFFALLIGLGEELLFRGLLMAALRQKMAVIAAMLISSGYYAFLHFLKPITQVAHSDLNLLTVWRLIPEAFANWLNPEIYPALIALLAVGLFLSVIRTRVRHSLGVCIGCHAGWVWQIKVCKDLFELNHQSDYLYLVSGYDGVIGPLVTIWLLGAMLVLIIFARRTNGRH